MRLTFAQFICAIAFSVVVVLSVSTLQQGLAPAETYQTYLDAATRCQDQLSRITGIASLASRYCLVLEELRIEALRRTESGPRIESNPSPSLTSYGSTPTSGADALSSETINHILDGRAESFPGRSTEDMVGFGQRAGSPPTDIVSWVQFESMVS